MSLTVYKNVEVEVDVDLEDLDDNEIKDLVAGIPPLTGDGDKERIENIIERAYLAARRLPEIPRELADLFWIVHGRACA